MLPLVLINNLLLRLFQLLIAFFLWFIVGNACSRHRKKLMEKYELLVFCDCMTGVFQGGACVVDRQKVRNCRFPISDLTKLLKRVRYGTRITVYICLTLTSRMTVAYGYYGHFVFKTENLSRNNSVQVLTSISLN